MDTVILQSVLAMEKRLLWGPHCCRPPLFTRTVQIPKSTMYSLSCWVMSGRSRGWADLEAGPRHLPPHGAVFTPASRTHTHRAATFSLHTFGGRLGLRGLPPVGPGFPGALQGQRLLLVNHDIIHPLVSHAAAGAAALLLMRSNAKKIKKIHGKQCCQQNSFHRNQSQTRSHPSVGPTRRPLPWNKVFSYRPLPFPST